MKIKWLGHASFLITTEDGTRIITDPYTPGGPLTYGNIEESAEIVMVSHEHGDHNNVAALKGSPEVIKGAGSHSAKGIEIKGFATFHDPSQGSQRGANVIFCFTADGIKLCHFGDLGHDLTDQQIAEIGDIDILMIPVGGFFTIDAAAANLLCGKVKPNVIIPMHYKTEKCAYPISDAEAFLKACPNVRKLDSSELEFKKETLPAATETVVLKHAL